jgi:glycosyltransferase involved in cell wall biosynthesis
MQSTPSMLSVVINTLNEAHNIRACLEAVSWADEIIVVDMHSDDATVAIAREYTDHVYQHERLGYVEPARNFALQQATGEWVLVLDADERVTPELKQEISAVLHGQTEHAAYRIPYEDYFFGKLVQWGSWQHHKHVRLHRRGQVSYSSVIHSAPIINGSIGEMKGAIQHYSHLTIAIFLSKMNTYTDIEAQHWFKQGTRVRLSKAFYYGMGKFLKEFIYYRGYRDGGHGCVLAALMGIYYFVLRVKVWERWYKHDRGIPYDRPPEQGL